MANESAIIAPIPEVESVVGPLRWKHDPAARLGVPAHITLLYPFRPAQAVDEEIEMLRSLCAALPSFRFSFTEVRRFPATVYLHPDQSEVFAEITRTLVKTWPDCRPYGGAHENLVPHLTIADRVDGQTITAVENLVRGQLPIHCVAREVWLLISDYAGNWSKKASFALAE